MPGRLRQRGVDVEGREIVSSPDQLIDAAAACQQPNQRLRTFHEHPGPGLLDQRRVADELDRVAQPLLGMEEDGSSFQRLPVPERLRKVAPLDTVGFPTPFVFGPAALEIARSAATSERLIPVRVGKVRLQFQGPAVAGDRFVQLPLVVQGSAQVVVRLGKVRLQFQGPAVAGDRFVQLPLVLQGSAQVVVRLGKVGLQFQCPAVAGDRFVRASPGPSAQCPGCCGPRQSPASAPVPGGSRRPLRPASPGPSRRCPGCCVPRRSPASVPRPGGSRRPLRPASPGRKGGAQVVVRLGIVRLEFKRPAVAGDGFVELPLVLQDIAQVVVRTRRSPAFSSSARR